MRINNATDEQCGLLCMMGVQYSTNKEDVYNAHYRLTNVAQQITAYVFDGNVSCTGAVVRRYCSTTFALLRYLPYNLVALPNKCDPVTPWAPYVMNVIVTRYYQRSGSLGSAQDQSGRRVSGEGRNRQSK